LVGWARALSRWSKEQRRGREQDRGAETDTAVAAGEGQHDSSSTFRLSVFSWPKHTAHTAHTTHSTAVHRMPTQVSVPRSGSAVGCRVPCRVVQQAKKEAGVGARQSANNFICMQEQPALCFYGPWSSDGAPACFTNAHSYDFVHRTDWSAGANGDAQSGRLSEISREKTGGDG